MALARVICLGAGGFVGSNMVRFLSEKGHEVLAIDKDFPEFRDEVGGYAANRLVMDLRYAKPNIEGYDWVFQFAADIGGRGYITDSNTEAAENNNLINLNVLRACQEQGIEKLFFSSSACAYPDGVGPDEARLHMGPSDGPYGEEKRHMTAMCEDLQRAGKLDARVGIFSTIYGLYQEYEGERMKFPTAITKKVIEARPPGMAGDFKSPRKIEIWGDGSQTRTFQFIDDALEKIYRVMSADKYEGPVNIGSDEEVTIKEIADELCKYAGIVPHYTFKKDAPTGPIHRGTDNTLFNQTYGTVPQTPASEGFRKLYDWQKELLQKKLN